jgi:hypothetical protein
VEKGKGIRRSEARQINQGRRWGYGQEQVGGNRDVGSIDRSSEVDGGRKLITEKREKEENSPADI